MSALDFLFEGRPPPSTTTYGTTSTDMPRWLSDYTQGLITKANAVAGEPYQNYDGPRLAAMTPDQQRAIDMTRSSVGTYTPWLQGAQGVLGQVPGYLNTAARTYPQAVQEYMDPYQEHVIDRAGTLAQRNLNEKFLPGVQAMFGAAGSGPRSTQMRRTVDQGVRDLTEGLHGQALGALSTGYTTGANIFANDMNRFGVLGNIASNAAGVGANIGSTAQNLALQDAAAQAAIGETLQGDQQRSLDLAYQDFQNQRDYPRNQVDWLSSVIRGYTTPESATARNEVGPANIYQPSQASQLGSLITTGLGIYDIFKGRKHGGRVRYKRGGRVIAPRGALAYA